MQFLPQILMGAAAVPSLIGGIMSAITAGKKLTGGRLRRRSNAMQRIRAAKKGGKIRHKKHRGRRGGRHVNLHRAGGRLHKKHLKRPMRGPYGRGVVADTLGNIPLLGMVLGPLAKAFGGKLKGAKTNKKARRAMILALVKKLRGKGLSPLSIRRPYVGMGVKAKRRVGRHKKGKGMSPMYIRRPYVSSGCGLSPMYIRRPYVGSGLLAPIGSKQVGSYLTPSIAVSSLSMKQPGTRWEPDKFIGPLPKPQLSIPKWVSLSSSKWGRLGQPGTMGGLLRPAGGLIHRKGHLRKIKGRAARVRVAPAIVGRGLLSPAGGYVPYHGRYGVFRGF